MICAGITEDRADLTWVQNWHDTKAVTYCVSESIFTVFHQHFGVISKIGLDVKT